MTKGWSEMDGVTAEKIQQWKDAINRYKEKYASMYPGKQASDKLVKSFCNINGIPWPLPLAEDIPKEWDFLL